MQQILNRVLAIILSVAGLAATLPVLVVVALAVKLDSRGPVLARHERAGDGAHVISFRSMSIDASGPRLTTVGRWLCRTRLDELPRYWPGLAGQMFRLEHRTHRF